MVIEPRALHSLSGGPILRWFRHHLRHSPPRDDDAPLLPSADAVVEAMSVDNDSNHSADDDIDMPGLVPRGGGDDGLLAAASLLCGLGDAAISDAMGDGERAAVSEPQESASAIPAGELVFDIIFFRAF